MSEPNILGGTVSTFIYHREGGLDAALAAAKDEQEAMCGYELVVASQRSVRTSDAKGDLYEVFVSFSPLHPPAAEPQMTDATQLPPSI